jgi:hypothetical protein
MSSKHNEVVVHGGGSDSVYGLGMIGAWVYYIGRAATPRDRMLGFLKGLVWPAMLVYEMLKFFGEELPTLKLAAPNRPAPIRQPVQAPAAKVAPKTKARAASKPARAGKPRAKKVARK